MQRAWGMHEVQTEEQMFYRMRGGLSGERSRQGQVGRGLQTPVGTVDFSQ